MQYADIHGLQKAFHFQLTDIFKMRRSNFMGNRLILIFSILIFSYSSYVDMFRLQFVFPTIVHNLSFLGLSPLGFVLEFGGEGSRGL